MAAPRKISDEARQRINEMYADSISSIKIAKLLNISASTVVSILTSLRKNNLAIQSGYFLIEVKRRKKFEIKDLQEMNRLYNAGATMEELGIMHGINTSSVGRYIWKPRHKGRKSMEGKLCKYL